MTPVQLLERTRRHTTARPRQVAMYMACKLTPASLPDIGQRFGGFDHTTVMYARDRIQGLRERDPEIDAHIKRLSTRIRQTPIIH